MGGFNSDEAYEQTQQSADRLLDEATESLGVRDGNDDEHDGRKVSSACRSARRLQM